MRAFIKEPWHVQGEAASVEENLRFEDKDFLGKKKGCAMAIVTTPFMAGGMRFLLFTGFFWRVGKGNLVERYGCFRK